MFAAMRLWRVGLVITIGIALVGCPRGGDGGGAPESSAKGGTPTSKAAATAPGKTQKAPAPLETSCTADGNCVPAPSCCPEPCSANVINKAAVPEARRRLKDSCPQQPYECPAAEPCAEHAYLCIKGHCKLVMGDSPDFRSRR